MKSFGLFLGFTMLAVGGCFPENFLADLASNATTTVVDAILAAVLTAAGLG
jgi:hypothetical protein